MQAPRAHADNGWVINALHSTALSGMRAASARIDMAGHNIANLATAGFRRQVAVPQELPSGGVQVRISTAAAPGASMAEDLVAQRVALRSLQANFAVFRSADEALGTLLAARA